MFLQTARQAEFGETAGCRVLEGPGIHQGVLSPFTPKVTGSSISSPFFEGYLFVEDLDIKKDVIGFGVEPETQDPKPQTLDPKL